MNPTPSDDVVKAAERRQLRVLTSEQVDELDNLWREMCREVLRVQGTTSISPVACELDSRYPQTGVYLKRLQELGAPLIRAARAHLTVQSEIGGWCVVDRLDNNALIRGPYKHAETAGVVRAHLESTATSAQNEQWNLWVIRDDTLALGLSNLT